MGRTVYMLSFSRYSIDCVSRSYSDGKTSPLLCTVTQAGVTCTISACHLSYAYGIYFIETYFTLVNQHISSRLHGFVCFYERLFLVAAHILNYYRSNNCIYFFSSVHIESFNRYSFFFLSLISVNERLNVCLPSIIFYFYLHQWYFVELISLFDIRLYIIF